MPIDTRLQRALSLAKAGRLEEAQNILLTLDSPEAEKLLDKVNKAMAARGTSKPPAPTQINSSKQEAPPKAKGKPKATPQQQGMGCLVLLVICGLCYAMTQFTPSTNYGNSPVDKVRAAVADSFGAQSLEGMDAPTVTDDLVSVSFLLSDLSEHFAKEDARLNMPKLACELRERGFTTQTYQFRGVVKTLDALGNEGTALGVEAVLRPAIIAAINCESASSYGVNIQAIAETYSIYPILNE